MDTAAQDDWKTRYRTLLEELENKEADWRDLESALRSAASRLGIAAMGRGGRMDEQLERVVAILRDSAPIGQLNQSLDALAQTVLDQERGSTSAPITDLADFIASLPLSAEQQRAHLTKLDADQAGAVASVLHEVASDVRALLETDSARRSRLVKAVQAVLDRLMASGVHGEEPERLAAYVQAALTGATADPGIALTGLANLLDATLVGADLQNRELQTFLQQVTERLEQFERYADDDQNDRDAFQSDAASMDSRMAEEVANLRNDVDGADDLARLKQRVELRLESIADHLHQFRARAKARASEADGRHAALVEEINRMRTRTSELAQRCKDQEKRLMVDVLTKVHTRYAYDQRIQEEFQRWQRHGVPLSYAIFDIDFFKRVNDTYGHQTGDRLLAAVAGILSAKTRTEDFVARLGGEEFVVLFIGTTVKDAHALCERLRTAVNDTEFRYSDETFEVTVSCGVTAFREGDTPGAVYERADAALYRAKNGGRNQSIMD